jgi:hypothetical protein
MCAAMCTVGTTWGKWWCDIFCAELIWQRVILSVDSCVKFHCFRWLRKTGKTSYLLRHLSACPPVHLPCLSVRMEQLGSHWTDFYEILCTGIFLKSIEKIQVSLISVKNNGYFAWRPFLSFFEGGDYVRRLILINCDVSEAGYVSAFSARKHLHWWTLRLSCSQSLDPVTDSGTIWGIHQCRCFLDLKKEEEPTSETSCFIKNYKTDKVPKNAHVGNVLLSESYRFDCSLFEKFISLFRTSFVV